MNEQDSVVALYEEVAQLTGKMVSAAHQNDWDRLTELEQGCANCMERIKGCAAADKLSIEARKQKIALLKTILANDREIRLLTEPWMEQLGILLGSASAECKLTRAYGKASD